MCMYTCWIRTIQVHRAILWRETNVTIAHNAIYETKMATLVVNLRDK
jgi:hypothetical protein